MFFGLHERQPNGQVSLGQWINQPAFLTSCSISNLVQEAVPGGEGAQGWRTGASRSSPSGSFGLPSSVDRETCEGEREEASNASGRHLRALRWRCCPDHLRSAGGILR